jgi:tetratricopeptide (TPR) repeat protein
LHARRWIAPFVGAALLSVVPAPAASYGKLRVLVLDERGQPLDAVRITVTVTKTRMAREGLVDADGEAVFPALPGGEVVVRLEKPGYQILEKNAMVQVGATATLEARLSPLVRARSDEELDEKQRRAKEAALAYNRGVKLFEEAAFDKAESEVRSALEQDPSLAAAHVLLARLAARKGDHAAAAESYERAIDLDPRMESHLAELVTELQLCGREEEAQRYEERLRSRAGPTSDPSELYDLAVVQINRGDDEAAADYLERALAIAPDHAPAVYQRGLLRLRAGRTGEALADLKRYLELEPDGEFAEDAQRLVAALGA